MLLLFHWLDIFVKFQHLPCDQLNIKFLFDRFSCVFIMQSPFLVYLLFFVSVFLIYPLGRFHLSFVQYCIAECIRKVNFLLHLIQLWQSHISTIQNIQWRFSSKPMSKQRYEKGKAISQTSLWDFNAMYSSVNITLFHKSNFELELFLLLCYISFASENCISPLRFQYSLVIVLFNLVIRYSVIAKYLFCIYGKWLIFLLGEFIEMLQKQILQWYF